MEQFKKLFDFNTLNTLRAEKGHVLISDPFLDDDYFSNSVILLCEVNDKGAFGLVLNHYIDDTLSSLMHKFAELNTEKFKLSLGGPVETDSIFYLHSRPDLIPHSIPIFDNLYLGSGDNFNDIAQLIKSKKINENEIKFFLGYSGWRSGQLEEEIEKNSWFISRVTSNTIMYYKEADIWKKTLEKMSEKHRVISNFPLNPLLN